MDDREFQLILAQYNHLWAFVREANSERLRWGSILLPLAAAILALGVHALERVPMGGVVIIAVLATSLMVTWRFIYYRTQAQWNGLLKIAVELEKKVGGNAGAILKASREAGDTRRQKSWAVRVPERWALDGVAALYVIASVALVVIKLWYLPGGGPGPTTLPVP